jgi:formylglycine-generating enzyme required for sulfatase activity
LTFALTILAAAVPAAAVTINLVPVGNAGNGQDTAVMQNDGSSGYGRVLYAYAIAKTEMTNSQYCEFLNAKLPNISDPAITDLLPSDTYGLYRRQMDTDARGGISYNPAGASGQKFSVKSGRGNQPVIYVCRYDAMRFANWMTNGQGAASTESGSYAISGGGQNSGSVTLPSAADRANWANSLPGHWLVPTEDEWYKAAYHKNDGVTANYWKYATQVTATRPYSDKPSALDFPSNSANYYLDDGNAGNGYNDGYAVTGTVAPGGWPNYDAGTNYLADVDAYPASISAYGTLGQAGSLWEFAENDSIRGASWRDTVPPATTYDSLASTYHQGWAASLEGLNVGFRLAQVPEPGPVVLAIIGAVNLLAWRWRRRR